MIFLQANNQNWVNIFQNQAWGAVDAIGGLIFGIIATYIAVTQFKKSNLKKLSYKIITNSKLISQFSDTINNKIKIIYNEIEVKNVNFIEVKIINNGNKSIEIGDFAEPLKVQLDENSKILQVNVTKCNPENLRIETINNGNSISISPTLLNKTDSFHLEIVATNFTALKLEGRIKDIGKIQNETINITAKDLTKILIVILFLISTIVYVGVVAYSMVLDKYVTIGGTILKYSIWGMIISIITAQFVNDKKSE